MIDGESTPSVGCQTVIMISGKIFMSTLKDLWSRPCDVYQEKTKPDQCEGGGRAYLRFHESDLREFQMRSETDMSNFLENTQQDNWITWKAMLEDLTEMKRLPGLFSEPSTRQVRAKDWTPEPQLLAGAAVAKVGMESLENGYFQFGKGDLSNFNEIHKVKKVPLPAPSARGTRTQSEIERVLKEAENSS